MGWSNLGLIDLSGGMDADLACKNGNAPKAKCSAGGTLNFILCDGGGEIGGNPPELCTPGGSFI